MGWVTAFITANLVGIGSNLDNSGLGLAYGVANVRISHRVNGIINGIGCAVTLIGALAGKLISHYVSTLQAATLSCSVLCTVGCFIVYAAYIRPLLSSAGRPSPIATPGLRHAILLGFTLSFTNLASGFGATVTNATSLAGIVSSITIWGYIMIWFGNTIGIGFVSKLLGEFAPMLAGLILIAVGIHQLYPV